MNYDDSDMEIRDTVAYSGCHHKSDIIVSKHAVLSDIIKNPMFPLILESYAFNDRALPKEYIIDKIDSDGQYAIRLSGFRSYVEYTHFFDMVKLQTRATLADPWQQYMVRFPVHLKTGHGGDALDYTDIAEDSKACGYKLTRTKDFILSYIANTVAGYISEMALLRYEYDIINKLQELDSPHILETGSYLQSYTPFAFYEYLPTISHKYGTAHDLPKYVVTDPLSWKRVVFQVLHTIYVLQKTYRDFKHNDLHPANVCLVHRPKKTYVYFMEELVFTLPNIEVIPVVIDFERATMRDMPNPSIASQKFIEETVGLAVRSKTAKHARHIFDCDFRRRFHVTSDPNPICDIYTLLNGIMLKGRKQIMSESKIMMEYESFVKDVIPVKLQKTLPARPYHAVVLNRREHDWIVSEIKEKSKIIPTIEDILRHEYFVELQE
jgi:hypothetical protein